MPWTCIVATSPGRIGTSGIEYPSGVADFIEVGRFRLGGYSHAHWMQAAVDAGRGWIHGDGYPTEFIGAASEIAADLAKLGVTVPANPDTIVSVVMWDDS